MLPPDTEAFMDWIVAKAVFDFHNNKVFNGWPEWSNEYEVYAGKVEELKALKYEQGARDTALSIENGEDV